ncbi:MAG TPA: hypothetical protein VFN82_08135, partial [Solirubrobacterales bacterium]|nr:hypothetical protein [Solirubrobacterales bacterium]
LFGEGGKDHLDGGSGSDLLEGGGGDDDLAGSKGADHLFGDAGDDRLLSFKGPDKLVGGPGDDFVDGQQGSDQVEGGPGEDRLLGDKGNDEVEGGAGDDRIEGGPGDDPKLEGGPGSDNIAGGTGIDHADGGPGDGDIVRGDNGTDVLSGGPGTNDIVSYAGASRGGIDVNLAGGTAKGDGHDKLSGFEDVVGSPQPDTIVGDGSPNRLDGGVGNDTLISGGGGGMAYGGPGTDSCSGFAQETSCGPEPSPPPSLAYGLLNAGLAGSTLIVQGSPNPDDIHVSHDSGGWVISDSIPIFAGEGCETPPSNPNALVCPDVGAMPLIVVTGGGGNDAIEIDGSVPAGAQDRINGNAGNDTLVGGDGDDVLEAGENYNGPDNGNDTLDGRGGSDVLYADPGADRLLGGPGNDLLVSSVPTCQGHTFDGGPGEDTVSYARSNDNLRIEIGGTGGPPGCGNDDRVLGDNESLEGSDGSDVLVGDDGPNSLMGHLGADTFIGRGGNDFVEAADGRRDREIDCGPGDDELVKDGKDPNPQSC